MKGLQVGDYAVLYQREDKSLALAAEYARDEDIEYYQTKLYKFAERLKAAIGEDDFERVWLRQNEAGPQVERWFHAAGCRRWLTVERDTRTNEIGAVR